MVKQFGKILRLRKNTPAEFGKILLKNWFTEAKSRSQNYAVSPPISSSRGSCKLGPGQLSHRKLGPENPLVLKNEDFPREQGVLSCATARPPVAASAGTLTLAGSPSIRNFIAKSVLSRITQFCLYKFQPQHKLFCREINFVANYPWP